MGCFCITAALVCCFHSQLKQCCSICCTAKKFTPSINYNVSEDRIVVVEQGTVPEKILANPYENHSENTSQTQLTDGKLARPESDKKQTKSAAPAVPVCDAVASALPVQQPSPVSGPASKHKTTPIVRLDTELQGLGDKPLLTARPATEYTFEVKATNKRKSNK